MRKLILSMQVSLDGFIEGPNGDMSWLIKDEEEQWQDLFEMLESVDQFLLGRVMFPEYRDYWKQALTKQGYSANEIAYAQLADKTNHVVFSNTMKDPEWANTKINNGRVAEEVARLKNQTGKDIQVVGGAKLAATVIEAGLVDEYRLTINPVIVGSGKSFFKDQKTKRFLELITTKKLRSGVVIVRYKVK
jgi:dihydrofolate reductase